MIGGEILSAGSRALSDAPPAIPPLDAAIATFQMRVAIPASIAGVTRMVL
jgi:hypothetical protein